MSVARRHGCDAVKHSQAQNPDAPARAETARSRPGTRGETARSRPGTKQSRQGTADTQRPRSPARLVL
eukprot:1246936-Rhodomonas_salina.1